MVFQRIYEHYRLVVAVLPIDKVVEESCWGGDVST